MLGVHTRSRVCVCVFISGAMHRGGAHLPAQIKVHALGSGGAGAARSHGTVARARVRGEGYASDSALPHAPACVRVHACVRACVRVRVCSHILAKHGDRNGGGGRHCNAQRNATKKKHVACVEIWVECVSACCCGFIGSDKYSAGRLSRNASRRRRSVQQRICLV